MAKNRLFTHRSSICFTRSLLMCRVFFVCFPCCFSYRRYFGKDGLTRGSKNFDESLGLIDTVIRKNPIFRIFSICFFFFFFLLRLFVCFFLQLCCFRCSILTRNSIRDYFGICTFYESEYK